MIEKIDAQIRCEWICIHYLTDMILQEKDHEKIARFRRDFRKSVKEIERLEREKLRLTATKLADQGIFCEVVKRHEAI